MLWRNDRRDSVSQRFRQAAAKALSDGARELLRAANETVPKEEGILESSGEVEEATPETLVAVVGYGGEAGGTDDAHLYAVRQHEDTSLRHDPGRRAKWLELAAQEEGPRIMEGVGRSMRGELS